jgi:EmrB/QacA subfamily drug resistance transporter
MVIALDNTVLNVALPTLVRQLHATTSQLQWVVDAYTLPYAGLLLIGGALGDRFGRARMLRLGLGVFGVGSLVAAFSPSIGVLIVCRAVTGVGAAAIQPACLSMITTMYEAPLERSRAIGLWVGIGGLGLGLGPLLGGVLLSEFWWGSIFLVSVPVALGCLIAGRWLFPESRDPRGASLDVVGAVLYLAAVGGLAWATIQAPLNGWTAPSTLAAYGVSLAVLVVFGAWELRCRAPMVDLHLFRSRQFTVANGVGGAFPVAYAGALFLLSLWLQFQLGFSVLQAGLGFLPLSAAFVLGGAASSRLVRRIGTKLAVFGGLILSSAGMLLFAVCTVDDGYLPVLIGMLLMGGGFSFALAACVNAAMGAVPPESAGVGAGMNTTLRQVGSAMGVAVMGSVAASVFRSSLSSSLHGAPSLHHIGLNANASIGSTITRAQDLGGSLGAAIEALARDAFARGMHLGMLVGLGVTLVSAVVALLYLPTRPTVRAASVRRSGPVVRPTEHVEGDAPHAREPLGAPPAQPASAGVRTLPAAGSSPLGARDRRIPP